MVEQQHVERSHVGLAQCLLPGDRVGAVLGVVAPNNPFGNLGRNAFRAPGLEQWDLGINKNFRITEGISVQFRSEFFNVLNHTNFGPPTVTTTSGAFGTITNALPARQIQFALKLLF